jgi:hypothetical protein
MCKNHLLGEHKEIHQLIGSIKKRHKLDGFVRNNLIEIKSIHNRHFELVKEMSNRGYTHSSPLTDYNLDYLATEIINYRVDKNKSLVDLLNRCESCKTNHMRGAKNGNIFR